MTPISSSWRSSGTPRALLRKRGRLGERVFRIGGYVSDVDGATLQRDPAGDRPSTWADRMAFEECDEFGRETEPCRRPIDLAVAAVNERHLGLAQPGGGGDQRVEHRLQIEGRAP